MAPSGPRCRRPGGDSEAGAEDDREPGGLVDGFYATSVLMLAVIARRAVTGLRPRGEEDDGRLEPLTATALPRQRWLRRTAGDGRWHFLARRLWTGPGPPGALLVTGDATAYVRYGLPAAGPGARPVAVWAVSASRCYGLVPRGRPVAVAGTGLGCRRARPRRGAAPPAGSAGPVAVREAVTVPAEPFDWYPCSSSSPLPRC